MNNEQLRALIERLTEEQKDALITFLESETKENQKREIPVRE